MLLKTPKSTLDVLEEEKELIKGKIDGILQKISQVLG